MKEVFSSDYETKVASDKERLKQVKKRYFAKADSEEMWETIQKSLDDYFEKGEKVV